MPAVDDLLADLAAHPPAEPPPVTHIRDRARRRVRRRRALTGLAAVLVVAAAALCLGTVVAGDRAPGEDVATGGGAAASSSSSSASTSLTAADATVILDPATGHQDGTVVDLAFTEPTSGPITIAQCAREVEVAGGGAALSWCVGIVNGTAEDPPPFTLARVIETPAGGRIDCAAEVARCILGVRVGHQVDSTDDRFAPLVFQDDLPPPVEPVVDVDGDEGSVGDGDTLLVSVDGVRTGDPIQVQQCRTDARTSDAAIGGGGLCDDVRWRTAWVQDGPATQLTFTAFHDVYLDLQEDEVHRPQWTRCEPCELVVYVGETFTPTARLPLDMEPAETPIRPTVELDPAGPHTWGQVVAVEAAGLQPATTIAIGWCPVVAPQGGGGNACWSEGAELPGEHLVDEDGRVVIERFALPQPGSFVGTDCGEPAACGVGLDTSAGVAPLAVAPLDLGG